MVAKSHTNIMNENKVSKSFGIFLLVIMFVLFILWIIMVASFGKICEKIYPNDARQQEICVYGLNKGLTIPEIDKLVK
jgi:hypothetical protein